MVKYTHCRPSPFSPWQSFQHVEMLPEWEVGACRSWSHWRKEKQMLYFFSPLFLDLSLDDDVQKLATLNTPFCQDRGMFGILLEWIHAQPVSSINNKLIHLKRTYLIWTWYHYCVTMENSCLKYILLLGFHQSGFGPCYCLATQQWFMHIFKINQRSHHTQ